VEAGGPREPAHEADGSNNQPGKQKQVGSREHAHERSKHDKHASTRLLFCFLSRVMGIGQEAMEVQLPLIGFLMGMCIIHNSVCSINIAMYNFSCICNCQDGT
jgi:hypothetical protein